MFRIANASYDSGAGKMKIMDIDVGFNGPKTVTLQDFKGVSTDYSIQCSDVL